MNKHLSNLDLNLFHQMIDGIVLLSSDWVVEYANQSFLSFIRRPFDDIAASHFYELVASDQDRYLLRESQTHSLLEVSLLVNNAEAIPVELSISPRIDEHGSVLGYILVVRDVALHKSDQHRLQQAMEKYRDIAFSGFDWLWEVDPTGRFTFISPSVQQCLGYSPEELLGRSPFDAMTEAEGARIASVFNRTASRQESFKDLVNRCLTRDGKEVVISTSGTPIFNEDGKLRGYRGGDRDISEDVNSTEALKESNSTIRKILENLPLGVVLVDGNKLIRQINDRACSVIGRKRGEIVGEVCHSAFCPALVDQCPILDLSQKIDRARHFVLHKDGHKIPVVKSVIPVNLNSEDLLLEVFIDISEIESLQKEADENRILKQEIEEFKKNDKNNAIRNRKMMKQRGELVSDKIAALGGITGIVDLLLEADQAEDQKDLLNIVRANCRKLTNAVHLMQNKMVNSQGTLPHRRIEFRLRKLLELVIEPLRDLCIDIDVNIDPQLPDLFYGPAQGIEGALQTILELARFRFPDDPIAVEVTYESSKEQTMEVRFSVGFPGIHFVPVGISKSCEGAFLPEMNRKMALCRKFAEVSGGELHSRDMPGSGCTFWLTIPLERLQDQEEFPRVALTDVHVLVLEKDDQLRLVYHKMLLGMGCRVTSAADRAAALAELREMAEHGDTVHAALLNGDVSKSEGSVDAKLLKHSNAADGGIKLILCSSLIKDGDVEALQSEGFSAVLRKPLGLAALKNSLIAVLGRSGEDLPIITEYFLP